MTNRLQSLLDRKSILLADGAMATNLFPVGLKPGDAAEFWNLSAPRKITDLHQQFVEAGADILLTNSFGANACRLQRHNKAGDVRTLNIAAAHLARSVAKTAQREMIVAGSIGPLGCEITPTGAMQPDEAVRLFRQQAEALAEGGVDLLWLETFSDRVELQAALAAAQSTGLPVIATLSFHGGGKGREPLLPPPGAAIAATDPGRRFCICWNSASSRIREIPSRSRRIAACRK
jgi:5-methyltetrahydrofolate--homocysteine methyltransferase